MGRKTKKQLDEFALKDRRRQIAEMLFEGTTVKEMAYIFRVDERTIYRDIEFIEEHSEDLMRNYLVKTIPLIINKSIHQIDRANAEAMKILRDPDSSNKDKLAASLVVAKTAKDRVEILAGNRGVVDKALELDESLKAKELLEENEFLSTNGIREEAEQEQDPNAVF